jgi:hypothetical protein
MGLLKKTPSSNALPVKAPAAANPYPSLDGPAPTTKKARFASEDEKAEAAIKIQKLKRGHTVRLRQVAEEGEPTRTAAAPPGRALNRQVSFGVKVVEGSNGFSLQQLSTALTKCLASIKCFDSHKAPEAVAAVYAVDTASSGDGKTGVKRQELSAAMSAKVRHV